jgi:hypothetical protein
MIPVTVRENDPFDSAEIDSQPGDVAREDLLLWPRVEEDSVPALATIGGDETGQAMGGTADAPARQPFHPSPPQITPLVPDEAWNGGQAVRYIVHQDMNLNPINGGE